MQEPTVACKKCKFDACCCSNLRIINKRHQSLCNSFYMKKLEKYFGIPDTDYLKRSISLKRTSNFKYKLIIKQMAVHNPLKTYIKGLPREINNEIYSYLWQPNLIVRISIAIPHDYPFAYPIWEVKKYMKNGKKQDAYEETQNAMCLMKSTSPTMTIDKEILVYVSNLFDC